MIKATAEILKRLEIEHVHITYQGIDHWATITALSDTVWYMKINGDISGNCLIKIKTNTDYLCYSCTAYLKPFDDKYMYEVCIIGLDSKVVRKLKEIEEVYQDAEKRKEKRFEIGLANALQFGFTRVEQRLIINSVMFPCIINNVSRHGVLLTTKYISNSVAIVTLILQLVFDKPLDTILLHSHVRHTEICQERFTVFSLEFLEPSVNYLERINQYEQSLKKRTHVPVFEHFRSS